MKHWQNLFCAAVVMNVLFFVCSGIGAAADDMTLITKEELKLLLGDQNTVIIDLRLPYQWEQSEGKIKGAVREDPFVDESGWALKYPKEKHLVLYCG